LEARKERLDKTITIIAL